MPAVEDVEGDREDSGEVMRRPAAEEDTGKDGAMSLPVLASSSTMNLMDDDPRLRMPKKMDPWLAPPPQSPGGRHTLAVMQIRRGCWSRQRRRSQGAAPACYGVGRGGKEGALSPSATGATNLMVGA